MQIPTTPPGDAGSEGHDDAGDDGRETTPETRLAPTGRRAEYDPLTQTATTRGQKRHAEDEVEQAHDVQDRECERWRTSSRRPGRENRQPDDSIDRMPEGKTAPRNKLVGEQGQAEEVPGKVDVMGSYSPPRVRRMQESRECERSRTQAWT